MEKIISGSPEAESVVEAITPTLGMLVVCLLNRRGITVNENNAEEMTDVLGRFLVEEIQSKLK